MADPITVWSLLVGSLGLQAAFVGGWLRWHLTLEQLQNQEEEEDLVTRYESRDTVSAKEAEKANGSRKRSSPDPRLVGWEFKIVRADRDLFRDPKVLKQLCEEESAAGWILLEKLDDRRIRFKRPLALREILNSEGLSFDPYRTHFGASSQTRTWLLAIGAIVVLLLPAYLGYVLVSTTLLKTQAETPKPTATEPAKPRSTPSKVF